MKQPTKLNYLLVGGAVRDELLNRPVKERDWVVLGATPEQMSAAGFEQVGKSFPVFLHPETHEEYALARKESKTAAGYQGFTFDTDPSITLEDDLARRDLTINAIAKDSSGTLIDPYGGVSDIQAKMLRHVSPAFVEDPVRVLRLARFAARFPEFSVAPETMTLLQHMVQSGEVDALVPDRVWKEWQQALQEVAPWRFYQVLGACGALTRCLPELQTLWQRDGDASVVDQPALEKLAQVTTDPEARFSLQLQPLSLVDFDGLCARLPIPKAYQSNTQLLIKHYAELHSAAEAQAVLSEAAAFALLCQTDAFRRTERFEKFITLCRYQLQLDGLTQFSVCDQLVADLAQASQIEIKSLLEQGHAGEALGQAIKHAQLAAISAARQLL